MNAKAAHIQEAWGAFFVAHALAVRSIESQIGDAAPLTLDEYDVLLTISRAPQALIRFSDLAVATVFTRSGISRITKRLEERGLLSRQECKEDKRGAYATLTSSGREAMRDTWALYSQAIHSLLDPCLSADDAIRFKEYLERIIDQSRGQPLISIGRK
jgi:DNA-binding MarR family transcriptional regulator